MPLYYILLLLLVFDFLLLTVGLYKPWIVLWWMPRQNRKLVLKIYGTLGAVLALLAFFLVFETSFFM